jgi:hypothetical protein
LAQDGRKIILIILRAKEIENFAAFLGSPKNALGNVKAKIIYCPSCETFLGPPKSAY